MSVRQRVVEIVKAAVVKEVSNRLADAVKAACLSGMSDEEVINVVRSVLRRKSSKNRRPSAR